MLHPPHQKILTLQMTTKRNRPKVSLEETNLEKSEEVRAGIGQQKDPGM